MYRNGFRLLVSTSALLTAVAVAGCAPSTDPEMSGTPALGRQEAHQSTPTGSMSLAGYRFTTTRLSDGRVLVVGGRERSSRADIYDPATGTFSVTTDVPQGGRALHATVRLNDGQALVTGGEIPETAVYALRYDPSTAAWSSAGTMNTSRHAHGAVALPNGRVLVTGGTNYAVAMVPFESCELFDPTTNTWTNTGSMSKARQYHSTVVLPDGRVLVTGGETTRTAELYEPATGTWSITGSPAYARQYAASLLLQDGRVLVVGGVDMVTGATLDRAELYDPATGTWVLTGVMTQARREPEAVLLSDGRVLVFGGFDGSSTPRSSVERFNPITRTWSLVDPMLYPRAQGGAALLGNDQVLLMGGLNYGGLAELYTDTVPCTPVTCSAQGKTCGVVPNGCGGMMTCGTCASGQACTADNVCVSSSSSADGAPLHDTLLQTPRCSLSGSRCSSVSLLKGRAGLGPELHAPNTLVGSPCADGPEGTYQADASLEWLQVSAISGSLTASKGARISAQVYASAQYSTNALDLYAASDASAPSWTFIGTLVPTGSGLRLLEKTYTLPVGGTYQAIRGVFRVGGSASSCGQGSFTDTDDLVFPVSPPPPPTAVVTEPLANARVQGQVLIKANATSSYAISRVEFYANSTQLCSDSSAPYECSWDTLSFTNGGISLKAIAYDPAGASGTSALVSVTLANDRLAPTASIMTPYGGQRVRGMFYPEARLYDDAGLSRGEVYLDDVLLNSANYTTYPTSLSLTTAWNSTLVSDGTHTLFSRAYDSTGKMGESTRVQFTVDNTPPTATLTWPANDTWVSGSVPVTAEVSDAQGLQPVALLVDGKVSTTKSSAPYSFNWNSQGVTNGTHTLAIRSSDLTGNQTTTPLVSVTVNNQSTATAVYDATRRAPGCASAGWSCDSGTQLNGRGSVGPEYKAPNTLGSSCLDGSTYTYNGSPSLDRLKVSTLDGTPMAAGKTVRIEATVRTLDTISDSLDLFHATNADSPSWTYLTTLKSPGTGQQVLSATYTLPAGTRQAVRGVYRYGGSASSCVWGGYNDHDDLFFVTQ